jgi:hypothetical protein
MSTETVEKPVSATPEAQVPAAAAPAADAKAPAASDAAAKDGSGAAAADGAAAPAADGKAVASGSILDGEDDEGGEPKGDGKESAAGDFPADWREKMAAGNEKTLALLKRYTSPTAAAAALAAQAQKIRSGELKAKLPDDATPEEKAAWRKDNGLPEEAAKYETALPNHTWTDADAPMLDGFKALAYDANMSQAQVSKVLGYYTHLIDDAKQRHEEAIGAKDKADRAAAEDALREKLGGEYRPALQLLSRFLKDTELFPEGMADAFAGARFQDGTRVINHPAWADLLITFARQKYGEGGFITADAKAAMQNEEEAIRQVMKTDFQRYMREGLDKKLTAILERKAGGGRAA